MNKWPNCPDCHQTVDAIYSTVRGRWYGCTNCKRVITVPTIRSVEITDGEYIPYADPFPGKMYTVTKEWTKNEIF